jgi:hypothetical protein
MGLKTFVDRDYSLESEAHFSVLQQLAIARPYIDDYLSELRRDITDHTKLLLIKFIKQNKKQN